MKDAYVIAAATVIASIQKPYKGADPDMAKIAESIVLLASELNKQLSVASLTTDK